MKKVLSLLLVGVFSFGLYVTNVQAANFTSELDQAGIKIYGNARAEGQDLPSVIGRVIRTVVSLLGVILLVLIIVGGVMWMTAGGDPNKVKKAQTLLMNTVIGLIIALSAYAISNVVVRAISSSPSSVDCNQYPTDPAC